MALSRGKISSADGQAAIISERICAGLSSRGLSSVTITLSAILAAILPINSRLPESLLPPQPKTTISLPLASGLSAPKAASRASGCARSQLPLLLREDGRELIASALARQSEKAMLLGNHVMGGRQNEQLPPHRAH